MTDPSRNSLKKFDTQITVASSLLLSIYLSVFYTDAWTNSTAKQERSGKREATQAMVPVGTRFPSIPALLRIPEHPSSLFTSTRPLMSTPSSKFSAILLYTTSAQQLSYASPKYLKQLKEQTPTYGTKISILARKVRIYTRIEREVFHVDVWLPTKVILG
ncbi:hypothetical protein JHW43_008639 [Diplocarpon mali]|nr:hypothetical protein JHW43_008639 [Diplocarpon mali]